MNPEFERNLWLELTPRRIVFMVAILALVFAASAVGGGSNGWIPAETASVAYYLIVVVWGARAPDDDDEIIGNRGRLGRNPAIAAATDGAGREDERQDCDHEDDAARRQFQPEVALEFRVHARPTCAK